MLWWAGYAQYRPHKTLHSSFFVRPVISPARIERTLDGPEPSGFSISLQGHEV